jgi:hypothetical protein
MIHQITWAQEPVMMQFKPGMADETTGGKKPADRFDVVENRTTIYWS